MAEIGEVDLLLIGGDITTGGQPEDATAAVRRWQTLAPRLLAVAGNMDSEAIDVQLSLLGVGLNGRGYGFGDVGVFGVSAAPLSALKTPYELDEDALAAKIEAGWKDVRDFQLTVFCPHAPPAHTRCDRLPTGEHVGSVAVRQFIERSQPTVVLCGHIHESRGSDRIGRSRIVNPGAAAAGHYAVVKVGTSSLSIQLDESPTG